MLYLNVTQSWFHDPKNWDDWERIFDCNEIIEKPRYPEQSNNSP
jgi:hypothetical protein